MHFIQENGFTCELDQIECDRYGVDILTRRIEESCWGALRGTGALNGCVRVNWEGNVFLVWYCANGDIVTLRSIFSAGP